MDFEELGRCAECKRRYGRAILTIRRWGNWAELIDRNQLGTQIRAFGKGKIEAEALSWAYLKARVIEHSPSFRWEDAELGRLLTLVVDCSEDPHYKARDPEELAAELLKERDRQRSHAEQIAAGVTQQIKPSLDTINQMMRALAPQTEALKQQQKMLESISQAMRPSGLDQIRSLMGALPKFEPPRPIDPKVFEFATGSQYASVRAAMLQMSAFSAYDFSSALKAALQPYGNITFPTILNQVVSMEAPRVRDLFAAGHAAAELVKNEDNREEAEILESVTVEAEEVVKSPSFEGIQTALQQIISILRASEERRRAERTEDRDQHQRERKEDRTLQIQLTIFTAILMIYLALLPYMRPI
jgi:hypothetical protein